MADFGVFETDAANYGGEEAAEAEGGDAESRDSKNFSDHMHHQERHHDGKHQPINQLTNRLMAYITDELIVIACFLAVFTICLAAMLPWYYASRNLIKSGAVSTPVVEHGLSVEGLLKSLDPLALTATFSLESAFVGCLNLGYYFHQPSANVTIPQIDESLNIFYMDGGCLSLIAGYEWASIDQIYMQSGAGKASIKYYLGDQASEGDDIVRLKEVKSHQNYPFDSYTGQLILTSFIDANGTIYNESGLFPVTGTFKTPTTLYFQSEVVGFSVSFRMVTATSNLVNTTSAIVYMDISRSSFTQGLSLFIVIVMWGISLGVTVLSLDLTYIRHYKPVSLGMAGLCATMLFALPSLRAVQPGIPPIALYSTIDIFSYFMNMALISASLILLLIKIIAENKDPKANIKKRSMSIGRNSSSKRYLVPGPSQTSRDKQSRA